MRTKSAPAVFTASDEGDGGPAGQFEALVSVYGNVDLVGDVVYPGAFKSSLAGWEERGDPIPIVYSHAHQDPNALLGGVTKAEERDSGLWVRGQLDLDVPSAAAVYRHMKARRLTKFSFAYDVIDGEENEHGGYDLKALDVLEVGPTLMPANPATELLAVKAGRVLSAANEQSIRDALAMLSTVLNQVAVDVTVEGEVVGEDDAKALSAEARTRYRALMGALAY